ncbi:A/G-specific adenine glycosylase [Candidatus Peregrinibacteria bacterium]|jgi:A/G-specific adenine glycosylase|nr:A/G-specific adenine glycosylase [Candidatus Peregrinibacteria bacterium]
MQLFEKEILSFYKKNGRKLPWRRKDISAYEVWVSEIMLQQTQVNRVKEYYIRFLQRFPTIFHLSESSWEEFLPYYRGLGYYRRGENMLKLSQVLCKDFGGEFPRDKKLLIELPGIGDYTASAILSFAYNDNHLAFDTNLQKVFGRFLHGNKKAKVDIENIEKKLLSNKKEFNAALMDFSNAICLQRPQCNICPLSQKCQYKKEEGKNEVRRKKAVSKFPNKDAQVCLWLHKKHKEYYSSNPDSFKVFQLSSEYNTREKIKEYFEERYNLELAVRPPREKLYIDGIPTLFINAQILKGEHGFGVFSPEDI